jgi:septum formation protein
MKLILGSKSPRRQELLRSMGLEFEIRTKDTDESYPSELPVNEIAAYLARKKAHELLNTLSPGEFILCADTIVALENQILGKPTDKNEATNMLKMLSGKKHEVITGVCLLSLEKERVFTVSTRVTFSELSPELINYYIENYQPFDKAGGYGIQEWIGYVAVSRIEGSYFNVVGLPTHETHQAIQEFN